ncbi:substrate-binding domain-containing protein [Desertimonas flava]|jgi:ribose transport system substrate-binding protein|uniref:substrate-binding domain-containing protein n=1 Tax=Desertimonas flava TaxID=2064846 RepID=UPI000E340CA6|nr:substrate-binding domain-containing protein [Desertimonas flava]
MSKRITSTRSGLRRAGLALGAGAVIAGGVAGSAAATTEPAGDGEQIVIGFSAPAADHGWMAAITENARAYAEANPDIDLRVADGTNDVNLQISQVETFINDGVDAIVLLPFDGAALTPIALQAMEAGIPVINVDREFDDPNASRATILGDNYGMGVSAGQYICGELGDNPDAVVAEIQGIASLPLTQDRSRGFADALAECGLDVDNQVSAEFTVESGEEAAANLLQAAPQIDAIWNHDDDQGVGVMAAIATAGRDEFFVVGGAGSANVMREIQEGGLVRATVIYPASQGADGVALARLVANGEALADLVDVEVPRLIQLYAPVVTADNVDQYIDSAFES